MEIGTGIQVTPSILHTIVPGLPSTSFLVGTWSSSLLVLLANAPSSQAQLTLPLPDAAFSVTPQSIPSPVALWVLLVHCSVLKFPSAFLPPCLHRSLLAHSHCGLAVAHTRWLESASGWTNRFQDTVTS